MASKLTPKNSLNTSDQLDDPFQLVPTLKQHLDTPAKLLIAFSGGVDSLVLLDQLVVQSKHFPFQLHAMHVHHGLSHYADQWAAHCQYICQSYQVPLTIQRVAINKHSGHGLEGAARAARYQALEQYRFDGQKPDWIVTAHHQADQAETLLLQLSRGAGVKGLAGMPVVSEQQRLLRPMLHVEKALILEYANQNNLRWCDDESNLNIDFDRNFIRHQVMPVLASRYPHVSQSMARSASHAATAQVLNDDLARIDTGDLAKADRLYLAPLKKLSVDRINNVLRYWLGLHQLQMPSQKQLQVIAEQLLAAKEDASIKIVVQHAFVMRYDGYAYLVLQRDLVEPTAFEYKWQGQHNIMLPNGYQITFEQTVGEGIKLSALSQPLVIKNRHGGERLKIDQSRPEKSLKQWFQLAKIPPWLRSYYPCLFHAKQLVSVPGIGCHPDFQPRPEEASLKISLHKG